MSVTIRKNSPLLKVFCYRLEQARAAALIELARYREANERPHAAGLYAGLIARTVREIALLDAAIARRESEHREYLLGCLNRAEEQAAKLEQAGNAGAVSARQVVEGFRARIEEVANAESQN